MWFSWPEMTLDVESVVGGDALGGLLSWPEGLRGHDVRVRKLALKHGFEAVLV